MLNSRSHFNGERCRTLEAGSDDAGATVETIVVSRGSISTFIRGALLSVRAQK